VSYSPALKWLLLPLLALTLGWKLAARPSDVIALEAKDRQLQVSDFLIRQHFSVVAVDKIQEGQPQIRANAGECRILIAQSPATRSDRDLLRRFAAADDHVFVVFHGSVYGDMPTWLAVADSLWGRFRRQLGIGGQGSLVLTVIATKICEAERLPWEQLN
jgi:hypothetical protein